MKLLTPLKRCVSTFDEGLHALFRVLAYEQLSLGWAKGCDGGIKPLFDKATRRGLRRLDGEWGAGLDRFGDLDRSVELTASEG